MKKKEVCSMCNRAFSPRNQQSFENKTVCRTCYRVEHVKLANWNNDTFISNLITKETKK